jgi:hypothetical protein
VTAAHVDASASTRRRVELAPVDASMLAIDAAAAAES